MPTTTIPIGRGPGQPGISQVTLEYEVTEHIPGLFSVTLPNNYGGTGTSEKEALDEAIRTAIHFKGPDWHTNLQPQLDRRGA